MEESWDETLAPPDTMADDAKDSDSAVEGAASADNFPGQACTEDNVSPEGQVEVDREGEAQEDVPPGNRKVIGHTRGTIKKYLDAEGPPA